ncbi:PAAR domain-containing protein [Cupriavidus sp. IK-TO18]|uniref:PAAR domain-containing protein n=1 Tax=Cupriavidus sp. IK-TO18 TaxID=2782182 RepID=UPI001896E4AF|nr:PAAR domain-containing protein [Cupriavidus sp. IK-TO18]MBF6986300.1 PAAR domain-containing protein [Cupriavidus sp. IK-TO18]
MVDNRCALRNGDKTSTNGVLIATGRSVFHRDAIVGVEGDHATCPACKAGGPVMNDCYPAFDIDGKQVLVTGARVHCKCAINPIVTHSRSDFVIEVNRSGRQALLRPEASPLASSKPAQPASADYDEQVHLVDEITQKPLAGVAYVIDVSDGTSYSGHTDEDGFCQRIMTAKAETLTIYTGDDAEPRM